MAEETGNAEGTRQIRTWETSKPIESVIEHIPADSPYAHLNYSIQVLEKKKTPYCELLIAYNPFFGNMMFIDGEVQICEKDYYAYHDCMIRGIPQSSKILVIGDGDGGFTKYSELFSIDIIDRDYDIIEAGAKYFGAEWDKVNLRTNSLQDFQCVDETYDAVILAVDDEFNLIEDFEYHLNKVLRWVKPRGKLVAQVCTEFSPTDAYLFEKYTNKYRNNIDRYLDWGLKNNLDCKWDRVYINCFRGKQLFFKGTKS